MEEVLKKKIALNILLAATVLLLYFFLMPYPLDTELIVKPGWAMKLTDIPGNTAGQIAQGSRIPYSDDRFFGYFQPDGTVIFLEEMEGSITISPNAWARLDEPTLYNAAGRSRVASLRGIPFFVDEKLYSASFDGMGLISYDQNGNQLWTYHFPGILSAFAASDDITAGGTIDGQIEVIDSSGTGLFSFSPGGSRLQVILGLAIAPDSGKIAVLSGIDSQRLLLLKRGKGNFRVDKHQYLDTGFRSPQNIEFLDGDRYIVYPEKDGVGIWAAKTGKSFVLPVKTKDFRSWLIEKNRLAVLTGLNDDSSEIAVFLPPERILGRIPVNGKIDYLYTEDRSMYFSVDGILARMDFVRE